MQRNHSGESFRLPRTLKLEFLPFKSLGSRVVRGFLVVSVLMSTLSITWLMMPEFTDAGRDRFFQALWREMLDQPDSVIFWAGLAAALVLMLFAIRTQSEARMIVTAGGIQARIPRWLGFSLLRQSAGHWLVRFDQIRGARLVLPKSRLMKPVQKLQQARLVLDTHAGEKWLHSFAWIDPGNDHRLSLGDALRERRINVRQRLMETPLVRILEDQGIGVEVETVALKASRPAPEAFDLTSHKGLLALLLVFLLAGGYAVFDTFFIGQFKPLEAMPTLPFYLAALIGLPIVVLLARGAPTTERTVVGMLALSVAIFAVWPGMLRYNAMTADPEVIQYTALAPGLFEPPDAALPEIDLGAEGLDEYWEQYPPGSEHPFTLLRGDAGFYQLDTAPLYAATRAFYRKR